VFEEAMGKPLEYKGYVAVVDVDVDSGMLHGEVINTRDVITFEATCAADLMKEFQDSVEDYLEFCAERGAEPEKPFSGQIPFRTSREIHRQIFLKTRQEGISMNEWLNRAVEKALAWSPARYEK